MVTNKDAMSKNPYMHCESQIPIITHPRSGCIG